MRISLSIMALVGLIFVSPFPIYAHDKDTVVNERGSVVVSTDGSCVRSKWDKGSDPCAEPEPAPPPPKPVVRKPVPQPARDARTVYFDFDSDVLAASETKKLDDLVRWLSGAKGVTGATVYGYADQMGNTDYNQKLSSKRAAAVESYLAGRGVVLPTNVEIVKGLGETGSLTQCDQSLPRGELIKCQAADRRVEIKFEIVR